MLKRILKSLIFVLILSSITSCQKPVDPVIECDKQSHSILVGTPYETKAYIFTSNIEGPRVAIIGGIHGDETAGWKCANDLLEKEDYKGTVMIIPNANVLADAIVQRYVGANNASTGYITESQIQSLKSMESFKDRDLESLTGVKFTDLNRAFPGDSTGTATKKIAAALYQEVISFNPDYVVDLHESQHSHTKTKANDANYLGDYILYGNSRSADAAWDMCDKFNSECLLDGETEFEYISATVKGSFCNTVGAALPNTKVFTFETNREVVGGSNTKDENRRIEQQNQLCNILLDYAYNDYLAEQAN